MTALLDAALRLASHKLPVFPCAADKAPAIGKRQGGSGFLDATTDHATIRRMFAHRRATLIGVPTGAASGFDALDADPRHGSDAWTAEHAPALPRTRTHQTKSGGCHRLFKARPDVRNTESRIAPGIDTRGEGGFIIWWPAAGCEVLDKAPIAPWPEWLVALAQPAIRVASASRVPGAIPDTTQAQRMVGRAIDRVAAAAPGQRHYALRAAAATIGGLLGAAELTEAAMARELLAAVQQAGGTDVDANNAVRTIAWGLERGARSPLEARATQPRTVSKPLARAGLLMLRRGAGAPAVLSTLRKINSTAAEPISISEIERLAAWCAQKHAESAHG